MQALNQRWLLLSLVLATLSGMATYRLSSQIETSRVNQYSLDKASVILALTDSYVSTYSHLRTSTDALPVPAVFRATALERFQQMPQIEDLVVTGMVGMPGNEIRTSAYDDVMRAQLQQMEAAKSNSVLTSTIASGKNTIHRSLFPSYASTQDCADCHNTLQQKALSEKWEKGDMMGAYVVDRFIGADLALVARSSLVLAILAALLTVALALAASYFVAQRRLSIKLEKLASIDPLTGCINRRAMYERIGDLSEDTSGALLMIDIDQFKKINDTYGHEAGDCTIKHIATLLEKNTRVTDTVGRVGGEEFCIILSQTRLQETYELLEKLRIIIDESECIYEDKIIKVQVSVGIARLRGDSAAKVSLKNADRALYRAKELGRNRVVSFKDLDNL